MDIVARNSNFSEFFDLKAKSGKTDRLLTKFLTAPIHVGKCSLKNQIVRPKYLIYRGLSLGMPGFHWKPRAESMLELDDLKEAVDPEEGRRVGACACHLALLSVAWLRESSRRLDLPPDAPKRAMATGIRAAGPGTDRIPAAMPRLEAPGGRRGGAWFGLKLR